VVLGHPFWGDLLHLDEVFADVPLVALMELDLTGLSGRTAHDQWTDLIAMRRMARGLTATPFQRSTYPSWIQNQIAVIPEGVDLERCRPDGLARLTLPNGRTLEAGTPLVSFATRHLEPLRGYDTFLRALPAVLERHPRAEVVICGTDQAGYGPTPPGGQSWTDVLRRELSGRLPEGRVHWLGLVPHPQLLDLFRLSQVHVYLTEPYVLSWSLLEAMACGALVVASDTAPVRDVIRHGQEGWLVPPRDPAALAEAILQALHQPERGAPLRLAARRRMLDHYEQRACSQRRIALLEAVAA
jgi:glycosyltransferase involved in cell wall biosynthesis